MHTFEYERFKRTFLQNHFSEKAVPISTPGLDKGCIFQDRRGRKLLKHMAMETMFSYIYIAERILGTILSLETDSVFMVTCFFCELLGENGKEYRKLVLISNNYTEVSDENGTLSFFFYDLKGSMYKNELTM